ncbi:MAG: polyprenyl synthetase family protein [Chloroflexota bacterium]
MSNWYVETFQELLVAIDTSIRNFINQHEHQAPIFWHQIYEHFDFTYPDATQNPNPLTAGKRIRPVLMTTVAQSICGTYEHVMPSAVALELIHNFTLIHDDIMDESDTRRGRTTIWKNYGIAQAIDSGDGLFALGILSTLMLDSAGNSPEKSLVASRDLLRACLDTVEGQALDISFEDRLDITPDEYQHMIGLKTGRLLEVAVRIGAYLSTDDEAVISNYVTFGKYLGLAFQMWDDYLGIWGDPEVIGKSATGDIEQKKKSYPITYAFTHADEVQKKRLHEIYSQTTLSEADVAEVLAVLDAVDARAKTQTFVEEYYKTAMDALDAVGLDNQHVSNLRELAQFIIQRTY